MIVVHLALVHAYLSGDDDEGPGRQECKRLVEGFNTHRQLNNQERNAQDTENFLHILGRLSRFSNLKNVTFQDDYSVLTDRPTGHQTVHEGEFCEVGSPFARSWPSRWPRPSENKYNSLFNRDELHIYATMIQGLSSSETHLKELFLDGTDESGVPIRYFDPASLKASKVSFLYHTIKVFSSLESLRLKIHDKTGPIAREGCQFQNMVEELSLRLVRIKNLKHLGLFFQHAGSYYSDTPAPKFENVFGSPCHKWPRLTHLEISGMTAHRKDLLSFLKAHSLKTLCMERVGLADDSWTKILSAMRPCLPVIETFLLSGLLFDCEGLREEWQSVSLSGYKPLDIEEYIKHGGENPLEIEPSITRRHWA